MEFPHLRSILTFLIKYFFSKVVQNGVKNPKCDNDDSFSTLKACIVHIIICIYYINAGQLRAAGWAVWLVVTARFAAA